MKELNIVFITDNNYIKPTIIAITSIYNNCDSNFVYNINVLGNNLTTTNIELLETLNKANFNINIIDASSYLNNFHTVIENRHVTKSAILKFYIPEIFKDIDKILYLDSDLIIQNDLIEIFNTNIENNYAGVVKDTYTITNPQNIKDLGLSTDIYFNSGVMLLNLKKMRADNITQQFVDFRLKNDTLFMDQDTFNKVIGHNVKYLSYKYNFLNYYLNRSTKEDLSNLFKETLPKDEKEIYKSCHIIHFGGNEKPWIHDIGYLSNIYKAIKDTSILKNEEWKLEKTLDELLQEKLLEILENNSSKKIMFWGASKFLEDFLAKQNKIFDNVIGIIDNNQNRWEQKIQNYTIYSSKKLLDINDVLIVFTVKNNSDKIYTSVVKQINDMNNHTISISANIFNQKIKAFNDTNSIYIVKNGEKQKVDSINGIDIIFEGNNNIIEIGGDPFPNFSNCIMRLKNNNYIKIESSKYNINELNLRVEGSNTKLSIGKDFAIRSGMILLDNNLEMEIGDDCMFSGGIYMRTSDGHTVIDNTTKQVLNRPEKLSIGIGNHVWIGSGASILKNTKISDNSIVARASVVTKKFDTPNVVLAGTPAKITKTNINWDRRSIEKYEREVLNA